MTHATRARKERGAKIVAVDIYMNGTMEQADLPVLIRRAPTARSPARSCIACSATAKRTGTISNATPTCRASLKRMCGRAARNGPRAITGCPVETIEEFARLVGERKRAFFRLGYGFSRSRNGAANMHAASCIPAVTGAWLHEGGGAFHNNRAIYHWDKTMIEGTDRHDPSIRMLDQSRIGAILTGEREALRGGPPVTALLIQNTNPMSVAPDQEVVKRGFAREDLFVCVHEQFMTETAAMADIVLPATMFLEHDDIYQGGGHQYILLGPKLIEPPGECRSNHEVICSLAGRLGAQHPGFAMTPRELIDWTLRNSGWGDLAELEAKRWIDCQPDFEHLALRQRLRLAGRQIPLEGRTGRTSRSDADPVRAGRCHAQPPRPLGGDRGGGCGASVPAGDLAGARLPQFQLHRDADLAGEGRPPDGDDPSGRRRNARHRRWRNGRARQHARASAPACPAFRGRASRRADRRIGLARMPPMTMAAASTR